MSRAMRLKMLCQSFKRTLVGLNLFKSIPPSEEEIILRRQRHQTRLYLVLLLEGLIILTYSISLRSNTIIDTVESPSNESFIQLYNQYPFTLDCPCSQTILEYKQFIFGIKAQYHEICSSEFISSRWIDLQFIESPVRIFFTNDIRYQSQIHFQLLQTLCRVAHQTVDDNLQSFYRTKFITNKVITHASFQIQVDLIIDQFKKTIPGSYQRTLQLIQANPEVNQLVVPLNSEFRSTRDINNNEIFTLTSILLPSGKRPGCEINTNCMCFFLLSNECVLRTMILEKSNMIPGMIQAVFPLRSVLLSTLECFYDSTCLSRITQKINPFLSTTNFSTLRLSLLSMNQSEHAQIDELANKLFIQSWSNQSSYESYFNQCYPLTCQYTYESQFNIIYIITTLIGWFGGLNVVLRLLIPYVITLSSKAWTKITYQRQNTVRRTGEIISTKPAIRHRLYNLIMFIKKSISKLDLFPTIPPSQDETILRRNRRLTRIYLALLFICLLILTVYTSITQETITVTVERPSISKYEELYTQYPSTLQCFCSNITVKYNKFITQMKPQNHSICSNEIFSSDRYNILSGLDFERDEIFDDDDFRNWIRGQLNTVFKMCSISQNILTSSLSLWYQRDLITTRIISPIEFDRKTKELIEEFKRITSNELKLLLELVQLTNSANQLATIRSSNWQFIVRSKYDLSLYDKTNLNIYQNALYAFTVPQIYDEDNCSCALQSNCSKFTTLRIRVSNRVERQILPNFRIGCLPLNALLQSSFSCFYNETCLYLLQTLHYVANSFPIKVLTESSIASSNRTIRTIFSQMFVEEWLNNTSFDLYYAECAPRFCQYSYSLKFNQAYFIAMTLAVFGGVIKALHIALSCIAWIVIKLLNYKKKTKVVPQSNIVEINLNNDSPQIISNPSITAVETDANPIREQIEISSNRSDRIIVICLCLLVLVAITAATIVCIRNAKTEYVSITTTSTTSLVNDVQVTESTTTSTQSCFMTLTYQSDTYSIGRGAKSLAVHDFNRDSFFDLAVTNHDDHTISILFGNGNGTFRTQHIYSTGHESYPWGIVAANLNNDLFPDIALTLSRKGEVAIFFGLTSNGSFTTVPLTFTAAYTDGGSFQIVEAHDLNDDGFTDLLVGTHPMGGSTHNYLCALMNTGDGRQYTAIFLARLLVRDIESVAIGDFDNDGKDNDISVSSLEKHVITLSAIIYDSDDTYKQKRVRNYIYGKPQSIIRGRFNDDELDDLALVAPESDTLHVLLADGNGEFLQQIYHIDNYPVSVVRINFNNDSIDDLAILTCNQTLIIYLGTKLGLFYDHHKISFQLGVNNSSQCFRSPKVVDLNHDGKDDLVFIDPHAQSIKVFLSTDCN